MYLTIKNIFATSAAVIMIVAWFASGFLENTYVNYPRSANPGDGRIVPYAVKGIVVYITEEQRRLLSWLIRIEIGSGLFVAGVIILNRVADLRSKK